MNGLRKALMLAGGVLFLWLVASPARIEEYRDAWQERTEISPLDVEPVAYQCTTEPRLYCSPTMGACRIEVDFFWSWAPCDQEPDPIEV